VSRKSQDDVGAQGQSFMPEAAMKSEGFNPEICFETPTGRVCLPVATSVPDVPFHRDSSQQLGDKMIVSEASQDLRRLLDFEAILADTLNNYDEDSATSRAQLARILSREAETVYDKAEAANLRAAPCLSRFANHISERISSFSRNEGLPKEVRALFQQWRHEHPNMAAYIAALPKAVNAAICRHRETTERALDEFAAGKPTTVELTCEGSTESCAILGFLAGAAAFTGNVLAGAAAVGGIAWCCS
jgi:hypothetical protein